MYLELSNDIQNVKFKKFGSDLHPTAHIIKVVIKDVSFLIKWFSHKWYF